MVHKLGHYEMLVFFVILIQTLIYTNADLDARRLPDINKEEIDVSDRKSFVTGLNQVPKELVHGLKSAFDKLDIFNDRKVSYTHSERIDERPETRTSSILSRLIRGNNGRFPKVFERDLEF